MGAKKCKKKETPKPKLMDVVLAGLMVMLSSLHRLWSAGLATAAALQPLWPTGRQQGGRGHRGRPSAATWAVSSRWVFLAMLLMLPAVLPEMGNQALPLPPAGGDEPPWQCDPEWMANFKDVDLDGSGGIDLRELLWATRQGMIPGFDDDGPPMQEHEAAEALQILDLDNDGKLSLNEYACEKP